LIRKEIFLNLKNFSQISHTHFNLVSTYSKNLILTTQFHLNTAFKSLIEN